jgi:hypothetical protein
MGFEILILEPAHETDARVLHPGIGTSGAHVEHITADLGPEGGDPMTRFDDCCCGGCCGR